MKLAFNREPISAIGFMKMGLHDFLLKSISVMSLERKKAGKEKSFIRQRNGELWRS